MPGSSGSGGDDRGHNDEHSPRDSGQAYQRTYQLERPRLWSSIMSLMEVRVVLVANRLKNCQKVEESSKILKSLKDLKNLQKLLVWRNVYQNTNLLSMRYKKLELPLGF